MTPSLAHYDEVNYPTTSMRIPLLSWRKRHGSGRSVILIAGSCAILMQMRISYLCMIRAPPSSIVLRAAIIMLSAMG